MFTGIVEGQGLVASVAPRGGAFRFAVDAGPIAEGVAEGDSVAVDGTCLTAVAVGSGRLEFDVVGETVERTAFAQVREGDKVNLERSMRADGRFHGHFVQGHVDGTGKVAVKRRDPSQTWMTFELVPELAEQMILKGSVAVDGVSLTITEVTDRSFSVAVIPHTLQVTTLGQKNIGALVNVELDVLGKWVRRLVSAQLGARPAEPGNPTAPPRVLLPPAEALGLSFDELRRKSSPG